MRKEKLKRAQWCPGVGPVWLKGLFDEVQRENVVGMRLL